MKAGTGPSNARRSRWGILVIVCLCLALGALYAIYTPAWQTPDEPAHYNYVRHIAETGSLPVLEPGDYPAAYLEELKSRRFPPDMSIDSIQYESHQPPLYYLAAAAVYNTAGSASTGASLLALHLFSVLLGGLTLWLSYEIVLALFPQAEWLAMGTAIFAATIPMHLSMMASANSDSLSELLVVLIVYLLVRRGATAWSARRAVGIGLLLGLAFLTKMQSYVAFAVAAFALFWDQSHCADTSIWKTIGYGGLMLACALLVALPWLVRNMLVYGVSDPLVMARHDTVVQGQLTTQEFIAQHSLLSLLRDGLLTTFRSFWGQFGWMAVPMHPRVYLGLALMSSLALFGSSAAVRRSNWAQLSSDARRGLALLAVWVAITTLGYFWWNTKYVQHQGRYLFPALVPIGVYYVFGLQQMLAHWRGALLLVGAGIVTTLVVGLIAGDVKSFLLLLLAAGGVLIALGHRVDSRWRGRWVAGYGLGMTAFSLYCLHAYILPFLAP